ncbi:adenylate/guanylate cyclase domain-containing protein [Lutimonas halocynthiae]|uniref:adenylate/guanylate cyclase domain-containing protein n=1 Tax=Lutimonas halocynthiae TaxID=1446477 RepID=UPI0025B40529|nr:adenylate/guanylate cyclase domain-containing protein [Lutimonas halocynthiae]MDN3642262.1 adenylate/guanylate cyclase domain-containing protein [Lutimonas halocynthiae]
MITLDKKVRTRVRALKHILKDIRTDTLLKQLSKELDLEFSILDINAVLMWGNDTNYSLHLTLKDHDLDYGQVVANEEKASIIVNLLNTLVSKDLEKKNIGNEVLGLYREINMIYDFSEKLSEKIEVKSIAEMALTEASQIIDTTHGMFLLLDTDIDKVIILSAFGEDAKRAKNIEEQNHLLKELIIKGTSAIVDVERIQQNPALRHLKAMMYAPLKVKNRTLGMVILGHAEEREFRAAELKLLTTISLQSAVAIESAQLFQKGLKEAQEREEAIKKIHQVSQKFVPTEFIKSLGKNRLTEVSLGDLTEKEVTVMFVDIREFTSLSEGLSPKDNFLFINSFNKRMGPVIRKNKGFIMQYLGDGFMALFPSGSQNALRASIEMHKTLDDYNKIRLKKKRSAVRVGIGMQNGDLIMGITGDVERLDAAIISDTVNTASRIEGLSKHFGTSILMTGKCMTNLTNPEEFNFRYLGPVQVIGKKKPVKLYECINGDVKTLYNHKLRTLGTFNRGMELYFNKEFAMSAVTFQQIYKQNTKDLTAKLFLNRAAHLITQEIDENWEGVQSMTKK